MVQTTVGFDWDSLLEHILSNSSAGTMLPGAGRFEYFLRQKGELGVTPPIAKRVSARIILTASNVLFNGEQIGSFVRVYSDGRLAKLQYSGIIPGCHEGNIGASGGEIVLKYYLRDSNGVNNNNKGFSIPFP